MERRISAPSAGLDALKAFCKDVMAPRTDGLMPKGVMLLGVPGTGKSAFAKALGKETSRPTLCLDLGSLMNKHVGETEANLRQALKVADAMAPCVLFIDEVEKGLAGTGSDSSGVTTRMFGSLLTWLNDHKSDVFVVCTCNNIQGIPPEFSRSGRFDAVYFIDTPTADQREAIWEIYERIYGKRGDRPECEGWTGAEIKACCYLAALRRRFLIQAATRGCPCSSRGRCRRSVPLFVRMPEFPSLRPLPIRCALYRAACGQTVGCAPAEGRSPGISAAPRVQQSPAVFGPTSQEFARLPNCGGGPCHFNMTNGTRGAKGDHHSFVEPKCSAIGRMLRMVKRIQRNPTT